jgi:hypothetical protein
MDVDSLESLPETSGYFNMQSPEAQTSGSYAPLPRHASISSLHDLASSNPSSGGSTPTVRSVKRVPVPPLLEFRDPFADDAGVDMTPSLSFPVLAADPFADPTPQPKPEAAPLDLSRFSVGGSLLHPNYEVGELSPKSVIPSRLSAGSSVARTEYEPSVDGTVSHPYIVSLSLTKNNISDWLCDVISGLNDYTLIFIQHSVFLNMDAYTPDLIFDIIHRFLKWTLASCTSQFFETMFSVVYNYTNFSNKLISLGNQLCEI